MKPSTTGRIPATNPLWINKVLDNTSVGARMIAIAIEGSGGERKYVRMLRQLELRSAMRNIVKVMLPIGMNPAAERRYFLVPLRQRGRPNVITSQTRRSPAMRTRLVVEIMDTSQNLGAKVRTHVQDSNCYP